MIEVVEALITAAGTVGGSVAGVYAGRKWGKKTGRVEAEQDLEKQKEEIERQAVKSATSLQDQVFERFGWKSKRVVTKMDVLDMEGNAHVTRSWRGVHPGPGMSISHLSGHFWVETPGGTISQFPQLRLPNSFHKTVALTCPVQETQRCRYMVNVAGSLTNADPPLDFDLVASYGEAILMSKAEVEAAYINDPFKYDYLAFDVETPIDHLEIHVTFPPKSGFQLYPGVFFGWSELEHDQELQRARSGFSLIQNGAKFCIDHPLVGFRYVLYWTAP